MIKRKMHSMIPSDKWYAAYKNDGGDISYAPLICWAHARVIDIDSQGTIVMDTIVGMIGSKYVECAEEVENFTGYIHESALPKDFKICSISILNGNDAE